MRIIKVQVQKAFPKQKFTRMYFFAQNLPANPVKENKNTLLSIALEKLEQEDKKTHEILKDSKFRWSQYCGCSCGCSPGLVSDSASNLDIFVDYEF